MNDTPPSQLDADAIFSQLDAQEVDEFYRHYQLWQFQRRIATLHEEIDALRQQLAVTREEMQRATPSPIALASLARLQLHDVNDPDLLDRLFERGDEWLDRTIQRLDYCERMNLIGDSYTQWCEHALNGAYDWIDSMQETEGAPASAPNDENAYEEQEGQAQTTEEMLLQRLMSEDDDIPTLKMESVPPTPVLEETEAAVDEDVSTPAPEENIPVDSIAPTQVDEAPQDTIPTEQVQPDEEHEASAPARAKTTGQLIPLDVAQTPETESSLSDEGSSTPEQVQPEDEQSFAPSEQYEVPEAVEDMTPVEADDASTQENASPQEQEAAPSTSEANSPAQRDEPATEPAQTAPPTPVTTVREPVTVIRPRRKRNFWQKLIFLLTGK